MKKPLWQKIAAAVAIVFSLLTLVEGSQVLLGVTQPEYIVLKPLLIYNVVMAIVGLAAGVALWLNRRRAFTLVATVAAAHIVVLIIVGAMYFADGAVALHSVQAMVIRSAIWLALAGVAHKNLN